MADDDTLPGFSSLPLTPELLQGISALGYEQPTPVQAQSIPALLQGRDVLAQAPTGSGKTAAFGVGVLHRIDVGRVQTQALVLCPTRELADQVGRQLRRLAVGIPNLKLSVLCGGMPLGPQLASLEHDPHVVVGTPGRIQELLRKKALHLRGVSVAVLDEADRMLDMGFEEPIREIMGKLPKGHQTLLFSATYPDAIRTLAGAMLRDPVEVTVAGVDAGA
ncbi:MAG: DEAD/DEAH box helicase, partial [Lysobacter spongiicola]|nr:DEAD/DEAH box helicase [Lysobacter spongiicola]